MMYRRRSEDKPHKQRQKCTQFIVLFICIKQQNNRIWAHLRRPFSLHHFSCTRPHGLSFLSSNNRRHTKYIQLLKCFICSLFTYFVFFLPSDRDTSAYNFFFFRKELSPNLCIGSVSQTYKFVCFIYSFSFFFMCALLFFCALLVLFCSSLRLQSTRIRCTGFIVAFFSSVQFVFFVSYLDSYKKETRCNVKIDATPTN